MVSHYLPYRAAAGLAESATTMVLPVGWTTAGGRTHDEPLRVELHVAARCQGTGLDPGAVSSGARPRWLRWALCLSGARPAGARCRRQCLAGRDRAADRVL